MFGDNFEVGFSNRRATSRHNLPPLSVHLDWQQMRMLESNGEITPVPVLYFTQLMALAMGAEPFVLGFEHHLVDPRPAVMELGL
jgi:Heterodisulfide reductase, subunit B